MSRKRKALCVGIDVFENFPAARLRGCANDAREMAALLQELLGFAAPDITLLVDAQATKANILQALQAMVKEAVAGRCDHLVFTLSTYGTLVRNSDDEPDNVDDAFCPHDLAARGEHWDPAHVILDDELHGLFVGLPRTVLLEVFLDTCYSGTGLRASGAAVRRRPRYLPPPSLLQFMSLSDGRRSRGLTRSLLDKGLDSHVLWAGCRADQTSVEDLIDGHWHGAFSHLLCKVLRACDNRLSRAEVLKQVAAQLKAGRFPQTPQLEGHARLRRSPIATV